ncbi:two-component system sensor histidine kinase/response regulator [Nostoc sp. CENA543]|uniref:response regulator n=1 Tax=Nostoc sp. CENA543 TaxID=1869241 RepID=UPI000CA149A1|nr:response regulator [Nostoc sp. CENA543]AUT01743.1 two-component system sensor histidine kinase/response regulator [Nostoc sp. CENA543]
MLNRLRIGSKIGSGFTLSIVILSAIGFFSYGSIKELIGSSRKEKHTYQVLSKIEELSSQLTKAETGQRGYIITGEQSYLEPYLASNKVLHQTITELQAITKDNPQQQRLIERLKPLINQRMIVMQEVIDLRRKQGLAAAREAILTNKGQRLMLEISDLGEQMKKEEQSLLELRTNQAQSAANRTLDSIVYSIPLISLILAAIGFWLTRHISIPLQKISQAAETMADGDLSITLPHSDRLDEIGVLTRTFNQMVENLRVSYQQNAEQNWLKSNLAEFTQTLQGQRHRESVAQLILSKLAPLVGAQQGVFYIMEEIDQEPTLKLLSSYAYNERKHLANQFRLGEGLVGQCALEKQRILLTEVPPDYIRISSGLGSIKPLNIIVLPIVFENKVSAVIELASLELFNELKLKFLDQFSEIVGVFLNNIKANLQTQILLDESVALAKELKQSNQLLEQQTQELETSELLLKQQQEELQQSNEELQQLNEELEEKAELLEVQNQEVARKNQAIEQARQSLEEKTEQLILSSKYKSQFLANMSHELRTPLNSLLILSKILADNTTGNLTSKQVEYSQTINSAGNDLLELINDILDIAKIESGTLSINLETIKFTDLRSYLERAFAQIAHNKGLNFNIQLDENLPTAIFSDPKRLQQILKNLLANAFKFTEQGSVNLTVRMETNNLDHPMIAFAVSDTGIGIPVDKQQIVFEAFQQADGTNSRKYGGTGLGLSISRELAQMLGGRLELVSQPGQGSTFTLYLPQAYPHQEETPPPTLPPTPIVRETPVAKIVDTIPSQIPDDRQNIQPGDHVLLIVEDDEKFARILLDMAQQQGFKVIVAAHSKQALALAQQYQPEAITLDINLPDVDGWTLLDRLKHDPQTRHIPVHIMSVDDRQKRGLHLGAITYLQKPVSAEALDQVFTEMKSFIARKVKHLLIIEDDPVQAQSIIELIGNNDVQSTAVGTGTAALAILKTQQFDCIVLDLGLPDMTGLELIEYIKQEPNLLKLPIIVYTGKELSRHEETQLRRLAETIIIKNVRSPERLLDETALFLHRIQANLPPAKRQILEQLQQTDTVLANRKILIIDDDLRNIFALTSLLESYQMEVLFAENGQDGIATLQENPKIDAVLMDVMMPQMDGYETTRCIRQQPQFRTLPIIALTAKAMPGDREKCIEAGASDYITKPVDTEQLLSLLRVWLYR